MPSTPAIADLAGRIEALGEAAHLHDECRKLVDDLLNEREALFTYLPRRGRHLAGGTGLRPADQWRPYLRPFGAGRGGVEALGNRRGATGKCAIRHAL